jgi:TRAP-type C4-dicarboxylate transport system substrate-binding protein
VVPVWVRTPIAVMLTALAALTAGCDFGGRGDKAGGSDAPLELRLAAAFPGDTPDVPAIRFFASRVAKLSEGSVRVHVVFSAAGEDAVDPEGDVARMVHDGDYDLGWIGARAWDRLGVSSFQALQAPFFVSTYALLDRIAAGPLASRMLDGLEEEGFVGLALVPDRLRHPMGVSRPFTSLADFAGAGVRVIPSRASDALMRALGARPVHVSNDAMDRAMARGLIDGQEQSFNGGRYVTANVSFFPKALTLFAARGGYERLGDGQRRALREAAEQTVAHVVAHPPLETALARRYCDGGGRVVNASRDAVTALTRAAQPVYDALERDAQTRTLIAAIRRLKATTPAVRAPRECARRHPGATGRRAAASSLNGTYRWRLTKAGAIAVGDPNDPELEEADGTVNTMTLRDGRWLLGGGATGTYKVAGDRIVFDWPEAAATLTFTFKRLARGDLDVQPVLPMDPGDRFVWASAPWRHVGPPVRDIP